MVVALRWVFCTDLRADSEFCFVRNWLVFISAVVFTARYGLISYIKQITFGLWKVNIPAMPLPARAIYVNSRFGNKGNEDQSKRYFHGREYTGCPRRNVPDFGRVFLRSNYTDIIQNTYIQSSMGTEILAREKCGLLWCLRSILCRDVIRLTFTATILQ